MTTGEVRDAKVWNQTTGFTVHYRMRCGVRGAVLAYLYGKRHDGSDKQVAVAHAKEWLGDRKVIWTDNKP